ncbi:MAG TPA: hypothetical protein DCW68_07160 [Rhodospirillaceae bacterium]|nr:MAG: hypothetical protein A2018_06670 [Alphaproteobacteria bacterium GWF2_58_20]HAU29867.1 hypothetical protein [Rhodospirillaceae bacterium]
MRLTTKGRYAVIALVDLASSAGDAPVSLASIAERQKISGAYLEQLFLRLRKYGIVKGLRGPGGGYILSRAASDVSIAEVIRAVDEPLISHVDLSEGLPMPETDGMSIQMQVQSLWAGLGLHVYNYLDSISIADVCCNRLTVPFAGRSEESAKSLMSCGSMEGDVSYAQTERSSLAKCDA